MNTEVHPREGNEHTKRDRCGPNGAILEFQCKTAEKSDRGLRVTAGEGISACRLARRFNDREIRILDPRARNAEGDLEKLVDNCADKADREQIVALLLVYAPENDHSDCHKYRLFAEKSDEREDKIKHGVSDIFKKIKKRHSFTSDFSYYTTKGDFFQ